MVINYSGIVFPEVFFRTACVQQNKSPFSIQKILHLINHQVIYYSSFYSVSPKNVTGSTLTARHFSPLRIIFITFRWLHIQCLPNMPFQKLIINNYNNRSIFAIRSLQELSKQYAVESTIVKISIHKINKK